MVISILYNLPLLTYPKTRDFFSRTENNSSIRCSKAMVSSIHKDVEETISAEIRFIFITVGRKGINNTSIGQRIIS